MTSYDRRLATARARNRLWDAMKREEAQIKSGARSAKSTPHKDAWDRDYSAMLTRRRVEYSCADKIVRARGACVDAEPQAQKACQMRFQADLEACVAMHTPKNKKISKLKTEKQRKPSSKRQSKASNKAFAVYLCNARKRCGDTGGRECAKLRTGKRKSRRTGVVRYAAPKTKPSARKQKARKR